METYGAKIARLREEKGWTQDELADRARIGKRTLQAIESGETENPQRRVKNALAEALGIEGDAEEERASWPKDVRVFLNVMGAYLTYTLDEDEREEVMTAIADDIMRRR